MKKTNASPQEWLSHLPPAKPRPPRPDIQQPAQETLDQRRRLAEEIKARLRESDVAEVLHTVLDQMERILSVEIAYYGYETAHWRLVWEVTFNYTAPWCCQYFTVHRLFGGKELDPHGSHYLGPAWEAPDALLSYSDEELDELLQDEQLEIRSAAGTRRIRCNTPGWETRLQKALCEAYQHPLRRNMEYRTNQPARR